MKQPTNERHVGYAAYSGEGQRQQSLRLYTGSLILIDGIEVARAVNAITTPGTVPQSALAAMVATLRLARAPGISHIHICCHLAPAVQAINGRLDGEADRPRSAIPRGPELIRAFWHVAERDFEEVTVDHCSRAENRAIKVLDEARHASSVATA